MAVNKWLVDHWHGQRVSVEFGRRWARHILRYNLDTGSSPLTWVELKRLAYEYEDEYAVFCALERLKHEKEDT